MTSFTGFLYHGSIHRFDEFETYEVRFSPKVNIPLAYATKIVGEGYLYEMRTVSKIPNILSISTSAMLPKLIALRNTLGTPTRETKYDYQYRKKAKLGNISSDWDDAVASLCEYEHVNGISMPKNENQIMLCRDAVKKYLKVNRIFKVSKRTDGFEMQQIVPKIEAPFHLSKPIHFPYPILETKTFVQAYQNRGHLPPKMRKYTYKNQTPLKLRKYTQKK